MSASHPRTTVGSVYRNASLLALVILWVASFAARPARAQGTGSSKFHVDSQRLQGTLEKLSGFGRNPEGGVTRIGFSETDMAAREYVIGLMKQAGLEVRVDPAGNIFGRRAGSEKLPILLFGSHIDSVLHGGNFDGDVGIKRSNCVVTGFANHAGTTPMNRRKDALAAASKEVLAVRETVRAEKGHQVGTVGYMKAEPGAVNVVPGRAEFPVELRDLDG